MTTAQVAKLCRTGEGNWSARARRDVALKREIACVFCENFAIYGVRKVWRQMNREGFAIDRCPVER